MILCCRQLYIMHFCVVDIHEHRLNYYSPGSMNLYGNSVLFALMPSNQHKHISFLSSGIRGKH